MARMLERLELAAGTGYNAALLSLLARRVAQRSAVAVTARAS